MFIPWLRRNENMSVIRTRSIQFIDGIFDNEPAAHLSTCPWWFNDDFEMPGEKWTGTERCPGWWCLGPARAPVCESVLQRRSNLELVRESRYEAALRHALECCNFEECLHQRCRWQNQKAKRSRRMNHRCGDSHWLEKPNSLGSSLQSPFWHRSLHSLARSWWES